MNEGFFSQDNFKQKTVKVPSMSSCGACKLHKDCNSPKMKAYGEGEKDILLIGESPSVKEDKRNEPMIGEPAQLLRKVFRKHHVDLDNDCKKMNAVSCCTFDEEVSDNQINWCRPRVFQEIKEFKPKLIFLLGTNAVKSFLGHRWKKKLDGINKWRGWTIPDRDYNCWVCPIFHPAFIIDKDSEIHMKVWKEDIERAFKCLDKPFSKYKHEKECIEILEGKELYKYLRKLNKSELSEIAIDFETTGLKPHRTGHQIVTCAIADDINRCAAFNMPKDEQTLHMLKKVLANPAIRKVAANYKFENNWAKEILDVDITNWVWDTMLTAHLQDNRPGISSLKFQAYVQFGIIDYDSHLEHYLKGVDDKDANSFNTILKAPRKDILFYNGCDSLFELRLKYVQENKQREET